MADAARLADESSSSLIVWVDSLLGIDDALGKDGSGTGDVEGDGSADEEDADEGREEDDGASWVRAVAASTRWSNPDMVGR